MTDQPNKYVHGKIYAIFCNNSDKIYIGSTAKSLSSRFASHKTHYLRWKAGQANFTGSFELFELGPCCISLLENYPCNNNTELLEREQSWLEQHSNPCVNMKRAHTNPEEKKANKRLYDAQYNVQNREKRIANSIAYRANNLDACNAYSRQYNSQLITCECGVQTRRNGMSRHRRSGKHLQAMMPM